MQLYFFFLIKKIIVYNLKTKILSGMENSKLQMQIVHYLCSEIGYGIWFLGWELNCDTLIQRPRSYLTLTRVKNIGIGPLL